MSPALKYSLLFGAIALFSVAAKAETYFLKIEQTGIKEPESYLQTCSPKTSPCTFTMPITLENGTTKDIAVVMRIKDAPYIRMQFYWDKTLLSTNNSGEDYHTILAGSPTSQASPRDINIYMPIPPEQKPEKGQPVLKYSGDVLTTLKVHATLK